MTPSLLQWQAVKTTPSFSAHILIGQTVICRTRPQTGWAVYIQAVISDQHQVPEGYKHRNFLRVCGFKTVVSGNTLFQDLKEFVLIFLNP